MKIKGIKTVGVIAEYNPFHNGHALQLEHIRKELQGDHIVVAMSGDFVQRGAPALFPKHVRARMALLQGADLVLELPIASATASAEAFAMGGVSLLDGLGVVDALCFGSECGDVAILNGLAKVLLEEPGDFSTSLSEALKSGMTYPAARCRALLSCLDSPCLEKEALSALPKGQDALCRLLSSPNNILGLEYCKAILRQKSSIHPVTLRRRGGGYHDRQLSSEAPSSATAIRRILSAEAPQKALSLLQGQLPSRITPLFQKAVLSGAFLTTRELEPLFVYALLKETPETLCRYLDVSPELARRIFANRFSFGNFSHFTQLLKTKELTQTRIQRALIHLLLGIQSAPSSVPYARILGFRKSSAPLLKEIKKRGTIPLLTKPANARRILSEDALPLFEETAFASNLYQSLLSQKTGQAFCHEYRQPVVIL
ncbi:MAG: nucleotidyltransferase family protein [Eubacteriales bacterium]|nr:nucleotidyltransferase family protein [Eubacteriales bacterium]